jgi:PhzF family phenazine biosynthesis protein
MTRIRQIDAFTSVPFKGNPAGVCILPEPAEDGWMQAVAAEMNVAETAFLWPLDDGFSLRWFTPTVEVDLCGHATLASAHALWESGALDRDNQAVFATRSGRLTADRDGVWIVLDFPAEGPEETLDTAQLPRRSRNPLPMPVGIASIFLRRSSQQRPFCGSRRILQRSSIWAAGD